MEISERQKNKKWGGGHIEDIMMINFLELSRRKKGGGKKGEGGRGGGGGNG